MRTTLYKGKHKVTVAESQAEHMKRHGYTTEKPAGKKSRKAPVTEEGSNNGENQG